MIKKTPPVIKRSAFLPIASPRLVKGPPTGGDWLHEIKFDGFRLQAHKLGGDVRLFSKNGKDFTARFPSIAAAVARDISRHLPRRREPTISIGSKDAIVHQGLEAWCTGALRRPNSIPFQNVASRVSPRLCGFLS